MVASLCGVLRAFFGDFLSLLSGMKTSVPLSTTVPTDLADMIDLLRVMGAARTSRLRPCPSARPGVASARATRAEGDHPPSWAARHERVCTSACQTIRRSEKMKSAEDRGDGPSRRRHWPALHLGAREGRSPIVFHEEKKRMGGAPAETTRGSRDR